MNIVWTAERSGWKLHAAGCAHLNRTAAESEPVALAAETIEAAQVEVWAAMGELDWPEHDRSEIKAAPCVR